MDTLIQCPRSGGGRLTLLGNNLGDYGSSVKIGTSVCTDVIHNSSANVSCTLPAGSSARSAVVIVQYGGALGYGPSLGYELCLPGTYQSNSGDRFCSPCPTGHFTSRSGRMACVECEGSSSFQPYEGQTKCYQCPDGAVVDPNSKHSTCVCRQKRYAIPFGNEELFEQLDPAAYSSYVIKYGKGEDSTTATGDDYFDPNEVLGFWCPLCPEGASCNVLGTEIETVRAAAGYFEGSDNSGSVFFPCLNDACGADGQCAPGYTGFSCTTCEEDLVLSKNFVCKACPDVVLAGTLIGLGVVTIFLYLYYKQNSKRQGKSPSGFNVFLKIVLSTFQVAPNSFCSSSMSIYIYIYMI